MVRLGQGVSPAGPALDPAERADRAARRVLAELLTAWQAHEVGVRAGVDPDALHQWRVALRRTRAVLGQLQAALPEASTRRFRHGFRWLQGVSSETRDLDVWLDRLPVLTEGLPPRVRGHLEPLAAYVAAERVRARAHLLAALDSPRHARLLADWTRFVASGVPRRPSAPEATTPIGALVRRRVAKVARQLRRDGRRIHTDTPAEQLHALRKTAKKLRYLLDVFRSVLPEAPRTTVITELKALQANLGDVQDLEVQASAVAHHAAAMMQAGQVSTDAVLAMGVLAEDLRVRQAEARVAFAAVFATFDRREIRRAVRELVAVP